MAIGSKQGRAVRSIDCMGCLLGRNYNIPVCLWLLDTHPYNPPMIYVKPTANMQIKPGRHVDMSGRIYLPYLHEWKHVMYMWLFV